MEHAEIYLRVKSGAGREKGEGETASYISFFLRIGPFQLPAL